MIVGKTYQRWQDSEELLKNNPQISKTVVEQYRDLVQKLEKLGVDTRPRYTLSPPLGEAVPRVSRKQAHPR